ncbi:MAG: hypothetical protein DCC57_07720 [Chloroflexi bacterium]|nr:MAG: hypothetical protein DCC57_07720 [Chloroflexota bacterium]
MKRYLGLLLLVFVGVAGWRIGGSLSPDALSMAVGVLFGVMAGVPAALLVMASGRRRDNAAEQDRRHAGNAMWGHYAPQPPVIVVAGPPALQPSPGQVGFAGSGWQPGERSARSFKVAGEREELIEDW